MKSDAEYKANLQKTREADAKHELMMKKIAKAGGISLKKLRSMSTAKKDAFITAWKDHAK